jgi:hypothetical protein
MVHLTLGVIRRNNYQKRRCGGVVCRCLITQRYSKRISGCKIRGGVRPQSIAMS